jgi:transcriptional regulator with XRE-family HTH domain
MTLENNQLPERLRLIRDMVGFSRREVEERSGGQINAASLSSYENNQSQISIVYIQKLVSFYSSQGITISYDWLITGFGDAPQESSRIDSNISSIKEANFFKKENRNSIIHTVETNDLSPIIKPGYIIGGILEQENTSKERIRIIRKNAGDIILCNSKIIDEKLIVVNKNLSISHINKSEVQRNMD